LLAAIRSGVRPSRRDRRLALILLLFAIWGVYSVVWGEKVAIGGGFGWDGVIYGNLARHFDPRTLDDYYFQRILPSALVHGILVALRQPTDNANIVLCFGWLNLGMMLASCLLYREIADELGLKSSAFWFGFAAIFVNFAHFKTIWYIPSETDATVTPLSLAMLMFYLRGQKIRLLFASVLGAFTWPTLVYAGTFLLIFRRDPIEEEKRSDFKWVSAALAVAVFGGAVFHFYVRHRGMDPDLAQPIYWALPLSILCAGVYVYQGAVTLTRGMSLAACLKQLIPKQIISVVLLWAIVKIPLHFFAHHSADAVTATSTIHDIILRSVVKPAGYLVSHPLYFGPAFLVLLFFWRSFSTIVRRYGVGLVAVILMGVFTSLTPESRQSLPSYVIAAPFLAILIGDFSLPSRFYLAFGMLALLSTKIWMPMHLPAYDDEKYVQFPLQNLFMNSGVWMNNQMYVIQGAFVIAAAVVLFAFLGQAGKDMDSGAPTKRFHNRKLTGASL
jgi:hypothetical protein